jgi:hypothetical protein
VLPPAAALEREMVALGVSEKQKERARQVFERSAEQAGFFEHGKNRLVCQESLPAGSIGRTANKNRPAEGAAAQEVAEEVRVTLIQALIEKLPPEGPWSADDRINWLKMLLMGFQVAYGADDEIEIKKKEAAN